MKLSVLKFASPSDAIFDKYENRIYSCNSTDFVVREQVVCKEHVLVLRNTECTEFGLKFVHLQFRSKVNNSFKFQNLIFKPAHFLL